MARQRAHYFLALHLIFPHHRLRRLDVPEALGKLVQIPHALFEGAPTTVAAADLAALHLQVTG